MLLKMGLYMASLIPVAALAASAPPPEPTEHPNWGAVNSTAISLITRSLVDPPSAVITWTSGFQWGYVKKVMEGRKYGWVACGTYNAKNRMGGYAGAQAFVILVDTNSMVYFQNDKGDADDDILNAMSYKSTCQNETPVPVNAELTNIDPNMGNRVQPSSIADELSKLAALRDKGVISAADFDAQKAKLLSR